MIVPGLNTQYISLAKNSSLAVAVGYADLLLRGRNHPEPDRPGGGGVVILLLGTYLLLDLLISVLMNGLNHLVQIRER